MIYFSVLLVLIVFSALFSGSETVLFSLSPVQVQRISNSNPVVGARLTRYLDAPDKTLSTLLIGNTLINFAIASIGYLIMDFFVPNYSEILNIIIITIILLLFCEVAPKRIGLHYAEELVPFSCRFIFFWFLLFSPFSSLMIKGAFPFRKMLRREREALNDEELLSVVEVGEEQGSLDEEEAQMVDGIMRICDLKASDVMTPRVDMVGIDAEEPLEEQLEMIRRACFRKVPVFERTPDTIIGFVNVVKLLLEPEPDLERLTFPAVFVPESAPLDSILVTLQRENCRIACVLDEFGGTAGLITRSDILEIISKPVHPTNHESNADMRKLGDDLWLVNGSVNLDEINHQLELELDADDADRISGWILFHAERMPHAGEVVEAQGCRALVRRVRNNRIELVQLEIVERPEDDDLEDLLEAADEEIKAEETGAGAS
ncbi:MAG: hemolysin family protein [Kiritimatiellia bacterium]